MRAYSMDLRVRVLADGEAGLSTSEVAAKQRVSESWVKRFKQRRREMGEIGPRPSGHRSPQKLAGQEERLRADVEVKSEAILEKRRRALGLAVGLSPLWQMRREPGLTLKKSPAGRRTEASGWDRPSCSMADGTKRPESGAVGVSR